MWNAPSSLLAETTEETRGHLNNCFWALLFIFACIRWTLPYAWADHRLSPISHLSFPTPFPRRRRSPFLQHLNSSTRPHFVITHSFSAHRATKPRS
ncbi:hypothetical protein B0T14DRAFT_209699 [Immersiella caudata]|uniref:Uncharacterized protein n=1 Tax=Immersiella caudata TaxID=314043 RepID=A0AA39WQ35_9PEZI|nr:hypothetical protein B0T14DRAFT_209699 [Immersiella caudata]